MTKRKEYKELILSNVKRVDEIYDNSISPFKLLADEIKEGKKDLKINTVDFIIAKILTKENRVYDLSRTDSFDVYVIGTFRKSFNPTLRVAEAFADFYLKQGMMPKIIPITKHGFMENPNIFVNKIKNGVLIYERR